MVYRKIFTSEERSRLKKLYMDYLKAETIKKFSKLALMCSKKLLPTSKNMKLSFTFGNGLCFT